MTLFFWFCAFRSFVLPSTFEVGRGASRSLAPPIDVYDTSLILYQRLSAGAAVNFVVVAFSRLFAAVV